MNHIPRRIGERVAALTQAAFLGIATRADGGGEKREQQELQ